MANHRFQIQAWRRSLTLFVLATERGQTEPKISVLTSPGILTDFANILPWEVSNKVTKRDCCCPSSKYTFLMTFHNGYLRCIYNSLTYQRYAHTSAHPLSEYWSFWYKMHMKLENGWRKWKYYVQIHSIDSVHVLQLQNINLNKMLL